MTWQLEPDAIALVPTACIAFLLAITLWRRRLVAGHVPFALAMLAVAQWELFRALEGAAVMPEDKLFFSRLEYIGIVSLPTLWLVFALEYAQREKWLTRRNMVLLGVMPLLTLFMVWTNDHHHLHWREVRPSSDVPGAHLVYLHGPFFYVSVVYNYLLLLASSLILLAASWRRSLSHRRDTLVLLTGILLPWVANVVYVLGLSPLRGVDPTPFAFTAAGLLFVWGVFGLRIFDVVPVARDILFERMVDGILVLDARNRIIDINQAARRLIGPTAAAPIGQSPAVVFAPWPILVIRFQHMLEGQAEVCLDREEARCVEVTVTPLLGRRGVLTGRLIVFRDITARKQAEEQLREANDRLHAQLAEIEALQAQLREQAVRDPLTGLFNRRYLAETLERELARAARGETPVSLVLLDIDHFKRLNDTFGHQAGDCMLQALAELLRAHIRTGDVAFRYGGEEFLVVLPGATLEVALRRAEHLRDAFRAQRVSTGGWEVCATVSLGIAAFPTHGSTAEEVLRGADQALYTAKSLGRDRVVVARTTPLMPGPSFARG